MSYLRFSIGPYGENKLRLCGSERMYIYCLIDNIAGALWDVYEPKDELLHSMRGFTGNYNIREIGYWAGVWFRNMSAQNKLVLPDGTELNPWTVGLNSVYSMGSNVIRFFVRLSSQVEYNCWGTREDALAIREVIRDGLSNGLCRAHKGWENIADALDDQFVTDSSTSVSFPAYPEAFPQDQEAWENMGAEQQWNFAWEDLMERTGPNRLQLTKLGDPYSFGDGHTIASVRRIIQEADPVAGPT